MRCLLVIWEPQYLRKKKVSWFSWNQLSWQTDQCSVTWECCLPILRKIIFNSQLTISIPRKPVSWRMRNYCAEDPIYIFFLFPWEKCQMLRGLCVRSAGQCGTTEDVNPLSWRLLILPVFRGLAGDFWDSLFQSFWDFFELSLKRFDLTAMILIFRDRI